MHRTGQIRDYKNIRILWVILSLDCDTTGQK